MAAPPRARGTSWLLNQALLSSPPRAEPAKNSKDASRASPQAGAAHGWAQKHRRGLRDPSPAAGRTLGPRKTLHAMHQAEGTALSCPFISATSFNLGSPWPPGKARPRHGTPAPSPAGSRAEPATNPGPRVACPAGGTPHHCQRGSQGHSDTCQPSVSSGRSPAVPSGPQHHGPVLVRSPVPSPNCQGELGAPQASWPHSPLNL